MLMLKCSMAEKYAKQTDWTIRDEGDVQRLKCDFASHVFINFDRKRLHQLLHQHQHNIMVEYDTVTRLRVLDC